MYGACAGCGGDGSPVRSGGASPCGRSPRSPCWPLAGLLPDFQLQSADGDSATRIAVSAGCGAGAFGLLSAVVWPLLVRLLLLVPRVRPRPAGLLPQRLPAAARAAPEPSGRGVVAPETAVIVAAVMSAVASATGAAPRRTRRRGLPPQAAPPRHPEPPGPAALPHGPRPGLRAARRRRPRRPRGRGPQGLMPTVGRWLTGGDGIPPTADGSRPTHRLTRGAPTGPARPVPVSSASCTAAPSTCRPSGGTRRTAAR